MLLLIDFDKEADKQQLIHDGSIDRQIIWQAWSEIFF